MIFDFENIKCIYCNTKLKPNINNRQCFCTKFTFYNNYDNKETFLIAIGCLFFKFIENNYIFDIFIGPGEIPKLLIFKDLRNIFFDKYSCIKKFNYLSELYNDVLKTINDIEKNSIFY